MSEERNHEKQTGNGSNKQYGKKGRKPRSIARIQNKDMDKIETNDPIYWNRSKNFENVSKFPWNLIVSYPRSWKGLLGGATSTTHFDVDTTSLNPPQIMALDVAIGPGWANDVNDGVNRALAQTMAKIRSSLSTSNIGFETADLGYFLTSTSSIAVNIGYAKKVLESFTVWKDRNYSYPRMLIQAMGYTYEDIRDNVQKYSAKLNALIDMYNNIGVLDIFDIYERQYALIHNIFCDEDSDLAQLYVFRPANYYVYEDVNSLCRSYKMPNYDGATLSFNSLLMVIEYQINSWYGSSDLYQINGILQRAFKDLPRQHIPYYEMSDVITPVADRAFLMQIMNATVCPIDLEGGGMNINQDKNTQNFVIWRPACGLATLPYREGLDAYTSLADAQILRLYENDISADDNMELTRLLNFGHVMPDPSGDYISYEHCGSEIVTRIQVYVYDAVRNTVSKTITIHSNVLDYMDDAEAIANIQSFRYMPTFIMCTSVGGEDTGHISTPINVCGDIYNWMVYDKKDWELLQFSAFQSIWTPKF